MIVDETQKILNQWAKLNDLIHEIHLAIPINHHIASRWRNRNDHMPSVAATDRAKDTIE